MSNNTSLISKYIFVLTMLVISNCFSQNLKKIKETDTLYVYFKKDKKKLYNQMDMDEKTYSFNYLNEYNNYETIWFRQGTTRSNEILKRSKSFLKRNKDIIVTYDFLKKFSYKDATELLKSKNMIYLIDHDDNGWFTKKLKEVVVAGYWEQSIE